MTKINIKNFDTKIQINDNSDEYDVMTDVHYLCKSCSLITDFLKKGCDVMQLANGDIIITEVKSVTFHYTWNEKNEKLVRVYSGSKSKKNADNQDIENIEFEHNSDYENDFEVA